MKLSEKLFKEGNGILRLKPTWVPRSFCRPGKRIKLHVVYTLENIIFHVWIF